jgi:hypothetical protein
MTGPDKKMDADIDSSASSFDTWLFARALGSQKPKLKHLTKVHIARHHTIHKPLTSKPSKFLAIRTSLDSSAAKVLQWLGEERPPIHDYKKAASSKTDSEAGVSESPAVMTKKVSESPAPMTTKNVVSKDSKEEQQRIAQIERMQVRKALLQRAMEVWT